MSDNFQEIMELVEQRLTDNTKRKPTSSVELMSVNSSGVVPIYQDKYLRKQDEDEDGL